MSVSVGRGEDQIMEATDSKNRQIRGIDCLYVSSGFGYASDWLVHVTDE